MESTALLARQCLLHTEGETKADAGLEGVSAEDTRRAAGTQKMKSTGPDSGSQVVKVT